MTEPNTIPSELQAALVDLLLSVADDKLMLGHRNADWTGLAPILEEDIAFSSFAQDEIAHASSLYGLIGPMVGATPDQLAFGRPPERYRCAEIVTLPDGFDWSIAIVRRFLVDHFDVLRLERLARSNWKALAELASRLTAEERLHVEHADDWIVRLATGTDESRGRIEAALQRLAPLAGGLFEPVEGESLLADAGLYPGSTQEMYRAWRDGTAKVLSSAGLTLDAGPWPAERVGGRRGQHTPALAELLDEMCAVYRLDPGAAW